MCVCMYVCMYVCVYVWLVLVAMEVAFQVMVELRQRVLDGLGMPAYVAACVAMCCNV